MNILLTLRAEIACAVILLYLLIYGMLYGHSSDRGRFNRMALWAFGHVIFAGVTEITVNRLDTVPPMVNKVLHIAFYMMALLLCYEFFCYVLHLSCDKSTALTVSRAVLVGPVAFLLLTPFLRIDYLTGAGTNYSFGPCVFAGYGLAVVMCISSTAVLLSGRRRMPRSTFWTLLPMQAFMLAMILLQMVVPELLFTGIDGTLITVGMFFALENPVRKYRDTAMMDMLTKLRSRNCYQEDLQALEEQRQHSHNERTYAVVACDLNGLKQVNDELGHSAGDELIRQAAQLLLDNLRNAYRIYRVGGDEFTAIYVNTPLRVVETEVKTVQDICKFFCCSNGQRVDLSIGYAYANAGEGRTLPELTDVADKAMYAEKAASKAGRSKAETDTEK